MNGRFDAMASCLREGLRVRKGGVVDTLWALKANISPDDMVVRRSEPTEVLRAEGPRHTPLQQSELPRFSAYGLSDQVEQSSYNTTPGRTV